MLNIYFPQMLTFYEIEPSTSGYKQHNLIYSILISSFYIHIWPNSTYIYNHTIYISSNFYTDTFTNAGFDVSFLQEEVLLL